MIMPDDCVICGKWPEADRWALRETIDKLPLGEDKICDECLISFLKQAGEPEPDPGQALGRSVPRSTARQGGLLYRKPWRES
jgi:hypothetical protein